MNKGFTLPDSTKFDSENFISWKSDSDTSKNSTGTNVVIPLRGMGNKSLKKTLDNAAINLEQDIKNSDNPKENKDLLEILKRFQNPELLTSQFFKYLSWAFFLLLPVFALLLKLFYIRNKFNYIRHLYFSVHIHSFIFIIFIILISIVLIFSSINPYIFKIGLLSIPVYLLISMIKVYKQRFIKTFLKFFLISFIYTMILVSAISLVMLKTLFLLKK